MLQNPTGKNHQKKKNNQKHPMPNPLVPKNYGMKLFDTNHIFGVSQKEFV